MEDKDKPNYVEPIRIITTFNAPDWKEIDKHPIPVIKCRKKAASNTLRCLLFKILLDFFCYKYTYIFMSKEFNLLQLYILCTWFLNRKLCNQKNCSHNSTPNLALSRIWNPRTSDIFLQSIIYTLIEKARDNIHTSIIWQNHQLTIEPEFQQLDFPEKCHHKKKDTFNVFIV